MLDKALVWVRRDLRADDHAALHAACRSARAVHVVFVYDTAILDGLPPADRRVAFIHHALADLDGQLRALGQAHDHQGVGLLALHGRAVDEIPRLAATVGAQAVFASHDDEPTAQARDAAVRGKLADAGVALHTVKDHLIFERNELLTSSGLPYTTFTPYRNAWLRKLDEAALREWPVAALAAALAPWPAPFAGRALPQLADIGFAPAAGALRHLPTGSAGGRALWQDFLGRIDDYASARDYPAVKGPSYLGPHLRFGTLSIRALVRAAWQRMQGGSRGAEVWLSELVWREFFHQILAHHPHVVGHAFRREFDAVPWLRGAAAEGRLAAWREGRTGYPLVDAAQRQLVQSGYMHNRLRMVSASFLSKHLGVDWRLGEAFFARHLNDFDLASNNGGWQWAAGTGCDAQPWFRIFNPVLQSRRWDAAGKFIRRYVPELAALPDEAIHAPWEAGSPVADYPAPIVDLAAARRDALARYAVVQG